MKKLGEDATGLKEYRHEWDNTSLTYEWVERLGFVYYLNVDHRVLAITNNQIYANAVYDCQIAGYKE